MNYAKLFIALFTLSCTLGAFESQKATMITQLYSVQRHQLMPRVKHKKFIVNYLNDAYKMLKCMQFSAHNASTPESQQYFNALTDYIVENFMYEWVIRKSHRFMHLHNNKLNNAVINLRNAIDAIGKTGLVEFNVDQEFNKTREWFTRANTEYFKKIGLKK